MLEALTRSSGTEVQGRHPESVNKHVEHDLEGIDAALQATERALELATHERSVEILTDDQSVLKEPGSKPGQHWIQRIIRNHNRQLNAANMT